MRHNGCYDTVFFLDMFHASADTIESQNKGLGPPESQEGTEQCKMKEEIADVREMFLLI